MTAGARQNRPTYLERASAEGFSEGTRLLTARSLNYAAAALHSLGWNPSGPRAAASRLGVQARHERLFARLEDMAARAVGREPAAEPQDQKAFAAELELLDLCGARLADVLRGDCDPLELLFGSASTLETLYSQSLTTRAVNCLVADVFNGIVGHLPGDRRLRVLEIGAGTGGATSHVLGELPAGRTEYCFTDLSPALVARARSRFRDHPFMRYEVLDIEKDLESQGFAGREFDVILAANVLHATADLRGVLARVRRLLSPAGLLVLIEGTRPESWVDLTFGLTEGWWKFTDQELRPDYPLLEISGWLRLLEEHGFSTPLDLGGPSADSGAPDYTVFVAGGSVRAPEERSEGWLVFLDDSGAGDRVSTELKHQALACVTVRPAAAYEQYGAREFGLRPAHRADYDRLLEEMAVRRCSGVAHMWSLDVDAAVSENSSSRQLIEAQDRSCRSLLLLAQALAARGQPLGNGLWALTRGSQAVGHDIHHVAAVQATVWGLVKVLALEHSELRVGRLDLDPAPDAGEAEQIAEILRGRPEESQWALRGGTRYVPRLVRKEGRGVRGPARPVRLIATEPGRLDSLDWQPSSRLTPGAGEVEIRVEAAALNFRDVLSVLGMYPGDAGPLGGEVAGVVSAVGPGVRDLAAGDAVAALAAGGFNDYVVTAADLTIKKPAGWSFAEIVTVPAAFATAYHALVQLAQIRGGETILIHTATGGVGLAAVQLARQAGCRIIATAGSPEKRDYLRSIGVADVFDSRSLAFADGVRDLLANRGVDVILNTLSGESIEASLSLLASCGRFVELGKRGIWEPSRVAALRPEAAYFIVDLADLVRDSPADFRPILAAAGTAIAAGTFRPLPVRIFPRDRTQAAFRLMAQARHIGKVVVSGESDRAGIAQDPFRADPASSYLITGGLSGLGLRTAEWLADRGARHVALMGRGQPDAGSRRKLEALRETGVQVLVCLGDVAEPRDVDRVLGEIRAALPPLRGVIHSAGVLDDGAILHQEWPRFERVLLPKLAGAWNLHLATRAMPLDFFVCYSSAAGILGSRGQANHASANAFLDALAHHRRGLGLPALSINWGAWSGIGAAVRRDVFDRVADSGVMPIPPEQGIAALERLMADGGAQAAIIPMDWTRFLAAERPPAERRFFAELGAAPVAQSTPQAADDSKSLRAGLEAASPAARRKWIEAAVRDAIIGVLGLGPEIELDPLQAFSDLGFDSLMSIELRNRLQTSMGRPLPATLAFDFPSLAAMADYFCGVCAEPSAEPRNSRDETPELEREIAELEQLSPADTEKVLAEELARVGELLS